MPAARPRPAPTAMLPPAAMTNPKLTDQPAGWLGLVASQICHGSGQTHFQQPLFGDAPFGAARAPASSDARPTASPGRHIWFDKHLINLNYVSVTVNKQCPQV